eukprot:s366_g41.t1
MEQPEAKLEAVSLEMKKKDGKNAKKLLKAAITRKDVLFEQFLVLRADVIDADRKMMKGNKKAVEWKAKPSRRIAEFLSSWMDADVCGVAFGLQKCGENLVERLRSGIQTSFHTCDYTTKPSLTCGPVLKHFTMGMDRLEKQMKLEDKAPENRSVLEAGLEAPFSLRSTKNVLSPEQQEARRRLCRLWTAANHAVMHGHCLMSIQLLTGREVIKTHVFWRLMLKRVLWGVFEEMRRRIAEKGEEQLPVSDVGFVSSHDVDGSSGVESSLFGCRVLRQSEGSEHIRKMAPTKSKPWIVQTGIDRSKVADSSGILVEWKVVDTTAMREYTVPRASAVSAVLDFVFLCFMSVKRPLVHERRKKGNEIEVLKYVLPALSVRVMSVICGFVGVLREDDGALTVIGNSAKQMERCRVVCAFSSSLRAASYGWHPEQLMAVEHVAVVSREISANLDFMPEARGRPRPSQRGRVDPEEGEDVCYAAGLVDIGDQGEGGAQVEDDLCADYCVKPGMQYQPRLHVRAEEVVKMVHRLDIPVGGPGRTSASVKRSLAFKGQYEEKYKEAQQPRKCDWESSSGGNFSREIINRGVKHQEQIIQERKDKELCDEGDECDDDFGGMLRQDIEAGLAPLVTCSTVSPAERALQLVKQRLPVRQSADGGEVQYKISVDQYTAVVLAITPLQRLWMKA